MTRVLNRLAHSILVVVALVVSGSFVADAGASSKSCAKTFNIRYSGGFPQTDPNTYAMTLFKKFVEQRTSNCVSVTLYPNNQLGPPADQLAQLRSGAAQMLSLGNAAYTGVVPDLQLLTLPALFPDLKTAILRLNTAASQPLEQEAVDKGFAILAYNAQNYTVILNTKRTVSKLADLNGLNIRTNPSPIYTLVASALGIHPTPLTATDVPTALQTGVIDGDEVSLSFAVSSQEFRLAPYVTLPSLQLSVAVVTMNLPFYYSLPTNYRKIVVKAANDAAHLEVKLVLKVTPSYTKFLQANGAHVTVLSKAEQKKWVNLAVAASYPKLVTTPAQKALVKALQQVSKK